MKDDDCAFFFIHRANEDANEGERRRDGVVVMDDDGVRLTRRVVLGFSRRDAEIRRVRRRGQDHDAAEEYAHATEAIAREEVRRRGGTGGSEEFVVSGEKGRER